jgi:acetyltransferase-like isoleucine patch superfamily enzyme
MIENLDKNKIQIGEKCDISDTVIFSDHVKIGNNCKIGNNVILRNCTIDDNAMIEDNVIIGYGTLTGHYSDKQELKNNESNLEVNKFRITIGKNVLIRTGVTIYFDCVINDNCWINHNAIIRENVKIFEDSSIGSNTICENNVSIGKCCIIQNNTMICSGTIIESFVFVGPGVTLTNNAPIGHLRDVKPIIRGPKLRLGCAIGGGVTISPGIEIGEESIVGAGSVVTNNVPSKIIVSGNPAEKIKNVSIKGLIKKEIRQKYKE